MKTKSRVAALAICVFLGQAISNPMAQEAAEPKGSVRTLQESSGVEAVGALVQLTRTPTDTAENLADLLALSRATASTFNAPLNFGMIGKPPFWSGFRTKGGLVLGRTCDSVRFLENDASRLKAIAQIKAVVLDVISGNIAHISPGEAIRAYSYTLLDPHKLVEPVDKASTSELLDVLLQCASSNSECANDAKSLLVEAAYLVPEQRGEILARLKSIDDPEIGDWVASVDRLIKYQGEPLSRESYRELEAKSIDELLSTVLNNEVGGVIWRANLHVLTERLRFDSDRDRIILMLVSDDMLLSRHFNSIVATPISEESSAEDKALLDKIIDALVEKLNGGETSSVVAIRALGKIVVADQESQKDTVEASYKFATFSPYGKDRVLQALTLALSSSHAKTRTAAVSELGQIASISEDVAKKVLSALTEYGGAMDTRPSTLSGPSGQALRNIDLAVEQVEEALLSFGAESKVSIESTEYMPPIPSPALNSRARQD